MIDVLFVIPNSSKSKNDGNFEVEIDKIITNPLQPRKNFDEVKMKELSKSIVENGILQPIIVREIEDKE